jgi:hypothetical protein
MSAERFIDRLAALVPPPRVNTLLYGGLFAANARLRPEAVGYRHPGIIALKPDRPSKPSKPRNTDWAELMRHSFGLDVLACPHCGGRMRHLATVLNHASIQRILRHEGLDTPEPRARSSRPRAGAGVLGRHARTRGRRGPARRGPLPRRHSLSSPRPSG